MAVFIEHRTEWLIVFRVGIDDEVRYWCDLLDEAFDLQRERGQAGEIIHVTHVKASQCQCGFLHMRESEI